MPKLVAALTLCFSIAALAQDYPLKAERPKPFSSTLIGVCEKHKLMLMVAIFTYRDGHVLLVDSKTMNGFADLADIVRYAGTAEKFQNYAQVCGDTSA